MRTKHIVVVGASAGGIEALRELVASLPEDFPAPICVVLHTSPQAPGVLDAILSRAGVLPARNARDRERLQPRRIYVAPPDCHLLIEPGIVRVTKGPRENRFRPAVDPLFRSAAQVFGPAAIGVVLTGNLDDGTAGLWTIKQLGGIAVVQTPEDALFPAMPQSALQNVQVDYSLPLAEIPALLVQLTTEVAEPAEPEYPVELVVPQAVEVEVKIAKEHNPLQAGLQEITEPSPFACPECHGVLLRLKEGGPVRFRCHTGHAYSLDSLLAGVSEGVEEAMWNAIRALEEAEMLLRAMADHASAHSASEAATLLGRADEAKKHSDELRKLVMAREPLTADR
jgi:two-component system, chemotaxis family, protein-glutamate methylesterase/glutaminase